MKDKTKQLKLKILLLLPGCCLSRASASSEYFFSRKWDVFSSSLLEQSLVLFRNVWNWGPGISLSCLTTASELLSFWVIWKLQLCPQTAGRGLHCHLSSSLLFCCIFHHLGDGYSDFPTIWLNVFLSRSYLILIIVAKFSLNRVVKP